MVQLKWGKSPVAGISELIATIPASILASPHRSVVPLVDFWRDPNMRLRQVGDLLQINLSRTTSVEFEYAVPVRAGRGKASFTDLMISGPDVTLAIEAKFTEPPYETVRTWLRNPPEDNRVKVLEGWLDLINDKTAARLNQRTVNHLPYQLIHRTASVCSIDSEQRGVVYLLFKKDGIGEYPSGMKELSALVPTDSPFSFATVECKLADTPELRTLETDWKEGRREGMGERVRDALQAGPLYEIGDITVSTRLTRSS